MSETEGEVRPEEVDVAASTPVTAPPPPSSDAAQPQNPHDAKGYGEPVVFRERYHIYPQSPIPKLDMPNAKAYYAEDRRDPGRALYALICRNDLPPRTNVMRSLKGVMCPGLLQLIDWGVATMPPDRRSMAVLYQRPLGGRVMQSLSGDVKRMGENELVKKVITPLIAAVRELTSRGISHRAIRPTNLYYLHNNRDIVVLGDCVTVPPAYDQPVLFEPAESAMSQPAGRGSGHFSDDMYSLGITILTLLIGRNPVGRMDDDSIIKQKITKGTFGMLIGQERLPLSMTELMRGLLCDDPLERWTMEILDMWQSGRRASPMQPKPEKRAVRGFVIKNEEYLTCRELALAISKNWEAAAAPILSGQLEIWLKRGIEDKERAEAISLAVKLNEMTSSEKRITEDVLIAKCCMILDPQAPIRYKNLSAMPYGFGPLLAVIMSQKGEVKTFVECVMREIPKLWFESRTQYSAENSLLDALFREVRTFLTQTAMGYGLERVLYEFNESIPCQSPHIADEFVVEIKELLPAMENAAKRGYEPRQWPIDRHIAAFIACRFGHDIEKQITALSHPAQDRSVLGMLSLLAMVQWRLGPESLPTLCQWVGGLITPIIMSYHSRARRKELEKELPALIKKGSLPELFNVLDNSEERSKDNEGFLRAQAEYSAASREAINLETNEQARNLEAERMGQQTAAVISLVIGGLSLGGFILARML